VSTSASVALLLTLGCSTPTPTRPEPSVSPREPAPLREAADGPLWLLTGSRLTRLTTEAPRAVSLTDQPVSRVSLTPDGVLWMSAGASLYVVEPHGLTQAPWRAGSNDAGQFTALNARSRREAWVAVGTILTHLTGTLTDSHTLSDVGGIEQIAVSPAGEVTVRTSSSIAQLTGDGFESTTLTSLVPKLLSAGDLTLTPDGHAWLTFMAEDGPGLLVREGGVWELTNFRLSADHGDQTLAVHPDGSLVAIDREQTGLLRLLPGAIETIPVITDAVRSGELRALAIDARHRAWMIGDEGLLMCDEGGFVTEWAWEAIGLEARPDALWVAEGGPVLTASEQ
jgi:hypothetical protein